MTMFRDKELITKIAKYEALEGRQITPSELQAFIWSLKREKREHRAKLCASIGQTVEGKPLIRKPKKVKNGN